MRDIPIQVVGDAWHNRDEVLDQIQQCVGEDGIRLIVNTEGPSLRALGIVDAIQDSIKGIGIDNDQVWVDCWHNPVETIPFRRIYNPQISHFFWLSDNYRDVSKMPAETVVPLAFFVGRLTLERAVMLWHVVKNWGSQVMVSLMKSDCHYFNMEQVKEPWIHQLQQPKFLAWVKSCPVNSITGHSVQDQYFGNQLRNQGLWAEADRWDKSHNTNRDLVTYYNHFHVELVSETYCLGDTFFPTEKTIRPLSQGKPMVIYGPKNFLRGLRKLGFQTWDDVWDESYDELEGAERWRSMRSVLSQIINNQLWKHRLIRPKSELNKAVLDYLIAKHKPQ
jgi:hypothetical protein